jgi:hypothetical protein
MFGELLTKAHSPISCILRFLIFILCQVICIITGILNWILSVPHGGVDAVKHLFENPEEGAFRNMVTIPHTSIVDTIRGFIEKV